MKVFFDFGSKLVSSTVQAHAINLIKEDKISDHMKLIRANYGGIDFPVIFKQEYGKKWTDILGTGYANLYLISEKMKTILEVNKLTGWKTFPIKLYDKKKNEISGYYGFSISGRCESITYENSEVIEKRLVPNGPLCKYYKGYSIEKWDGSDFFMPEKTLHTLITKEVADLLIHNKITNLHLKNIAEIETSLAMLNIIKKAAH